METTLLLTALTASQLTALAQTVPVPGAPIRPEWIDPLRFRQYEANKNVTGKIDPGEMRLVLPIKPAP